MNDYLEIDLKTLLRKILSKWHWVIVPAVILGLGAFIYSYTLPDLYRAEAKFTLTDPPYAASFGEQYLTLPLEKPTEEALKEIVLNNKIAVALYALWDTPEEEKSTLRQFVKNQLDVSIGREGMLIALVVQTENRENSALLANTWVALAMQAVELDYYGFQPDQVAFFESQTSQAELDLAEASQRMIEFAGADPQEVLRSELNAHLASQVETTQAERALKRAQKDVQALIAQLDFETPDALLDSSYRLSFALIQTRVLNTPVVIGIGLDLVTNQRTWETSSSQLAIDLGSQPEILTVAEFRSQLANWLTVMDARVVELETEQDSLIADITALQAKIQTLENESITLAAEFDRLQLIHTILATKYDEVRLTTPDGESGYVSLVSNAVVPAPDDRLPHNTVRNTLIGLVAGGFLGLAGVVIADWWKSPVEPETTEVG